MNEIMAIWAQWAKPSAGLPIVQWSFLLAAAAAVGYLLQRYTGLPKVVGYTVIGTVAGLGGFSGGRRRRR
jgi:Kef-type K+ transport system membrane component KefB